MTPVTENLISVSGLMAPPAPVTGLLFGFRWPTGGDLEVWKYDGSGTYVELVRTFTASPWVPAGGAGGSDPGFGLRDRSVIMHRDVSATVDGPVVVWPEPAQNVIAMYDLTTNTLATVPQKHPSTLGATAPVYIVSANQDDGWLYQVGFETGAGAVSRFLRRFRADGTLDTIVSTDAIGTDNPTLPIFIADSEASSSRFEMDDSIIGGRGVSIGGTWVGLGSVNSPPTTPLHFHTTRDGLFGYLSAIFGGFRVRTEVQDIEDDAWFFAQAQSGAALPTVTTAAISINLANSAQSHYPWTFDPTQLLWMQPTVAATIATPKITINRKDNSGSGILWPHFMHPNTITVTF